MKTQTQTRLHNLRRLGALVGQVLDALDMDSFFNDPITVAYGCDDCSGIVWRGKQRKALALVRDAGFRDYDHFLRAVTRRTCARFVATSGLTAFQGE